jgi:hypothetical protein
MIPGSNLLKIALRVIAKQTVSYEAAISRTTNAAGLWVTSYAAPVPLSGSFQPIDRSYYLQYGLDFTKYYANWYDPSGTVKDVQRNTAGDRITYAGSKFTALSSTDWTAPDGWNGTLFVRVPT